MMEICKTLSDGTTVCFPLNVEDSSSEQGEVAIERGQGGKSQSKSKSTPQPKPKQKRKAEPMELVSVHLPPQMIQALDMLVTRGLYPTRSEAIRDAIAQLILKFKQPENESESKP